MRRPIALFALAALPLGLDLDLEAPATRIRFAPAEGLALRKRLEKRTQQELDWIRVTMGGEEREQDVEQASESSSLLLVLDRYRSVADGRVERLERAYEDFEGAQTTELDAGGGAHTMASRTRCELVGHTVSFDWDADAERYAARSEEDEVESRWLAELRYELDFLALLPEGEVEVGDEWEVDAAALRRLMRFEQGLPLEAEHTVDGEARESADEEDEAPEPEEAVSGELTARFAGTREEEGLTLAVIELSGTYTVRSGFDGVEESGQVTRTTETDQVSQVELEGELRWNLGAGHFHAGEVEAASVTRTSSELRVATPDGTTEVTQESSASGTVRFSARFEPAE